MEKPFVLICTKTLEKICLLDLRKKSNFDAVIRAVHAFEGIGIKSNYEDPFTAKFQRTKYETNNPESGLIQSLDRPIKFDTQELVTLLRRHNARGKDKIRRIMSPASMQNLQKSKPWSVETKPTKPIQIEDAVIDKAEVLRQGGLSWKKVAERVGKNPNSLRSAIRRKSKAINLLVKV